MQAHWQRLCRFRPKVLYGFSRAVDLLAREASRLGPPPPDLKLVVLSGEPVPPGSRQFIGSVTGVPVVNQYGCTECAFVAGHWPDGTFRVREDACLVECSPAGGGMYRILLTVFDNSCFPLIRYEIKDLSDAPLEFPEQGFACMGQVLGRLDDVVFTRQGQCLHPSRLDAAFELRTNRAVRRYRVHQHRPGNVLVELETEPQASFNLERLCRNLTALFGGFPVEVRLVPELPTGSAGKCHTIKSDYLPPRDGAA